MVQDAGKAEKEMTNETTWGSQLRLPVQAAPVYRTPGAAALPTGSGVEAAQLVDWAKLGLVEENPALAWVREHSFMPYR
jgi:hypothetical protein